MGKSTKNNCEKKKRKAARWNETGRLFFSIITCMFVVPVRLRPEAVKQTLNFKLDLQGHGLLVVSV